MLFTFYISFLSFSDFVTNVDIVLLCLQVFTVRTVKPNSCMMWYLTNHSQVVFLSIAQTIVVIDCPDLPYWIYLMANA